MGVVYHVATSREPFSRPLSIISEQLEKKIDISQESTQTKAGN
jgi:hypothetical protein